MTVPATELRILQVGDRWEYELTGSAARAGHVVPLVGSIVVTIERRVAGGRERLAVVFAQDRRIAGVDGPDAAFPMPTGAFYFEQFPDRLDVAIVGDNMGPGGRDRFALAPQVFYPGRWSPTTAYANVLDFGADGRVANRLETVGVERIETGAGPLVAWKTVIGSTSELFGIVEGHDYWAPQLGAPAAFDMTATAPDGSTLTTAARLRAAHLGSR